MQLLLCLPLMILTAAGVETGVCLALVALALAAETGVLPAALLGLGGLPTWFLNATNQKTNQSDIKEACKTH